MHYFPPAEILGAHELLYSEWCQEVSDSVDRLLDKHLIASNMRLHLTCPEDEVPASFMETDDTNADAVDAGDRGKLEEAGGGGGDQGGGDGGGGGEGVSPGGSGGGDAWFDTWQLNYRHDGMAASTIAYWSEPPWDHQMFLRQLSIPHRHLMPSRLVLALRAACGSAT